MVAKRVKIIGSFVIWKCFRSDLSEGQWGLLVNGGRYLLDYNISELKMDDVEIVSTKAVTEEAPIGSVDELEL